MNERDGSLPKTAPGRPSEGRAILRAEAMAASNENLVAITGGPTELIDEARLAAQLGVSRSTLQSWRYAGRGPRWIKLGRLIRYRIADVDTFLEANTRGRVA